MENLTFESWLLIGLFVFLFLTSIAMSFHIINRYPPEQIPAQDDSSQIGEPILDGVLDDD